MVSSSFAKSQILSVLLSLLFGAGCNNGILNVGNSNARKSPPISAFGQAYQFNGTTSSVQLVGTAISFWTSQTTVEMFFQTTAATNQYLLSSASVSTIYIQLNSSGQIGVDTPNAAACAGNNGIMLTPGSYNDGKVHHLAVIFDSTGGSQKVFVDGILVLSFTPAAAYGTCSFSNFYIGSYTGSSNFFAGIIDEVRISSTARYGGGFAVPGSPFIYDGSTSMLFHFDTTQSVDYYPSGTYTTTNTSSVPSPIF